VSDDQLAVTEYRLDLVGDPLTVLAVGNAAQRVPLIVVIVRQGASVWGDCRLLRHRRCNQQEGEQ
jgi:hypothetical protein